MKASGESISRLKILLYKLKMTKYDFNRIIISSVKRLQPTLEVQKIYLQYFSFTVIMQII